MNNLFLFTGTETYLLQEQLKAWKKAFLEKHGDLNLDVLDASELPLKEIEVPLFTAPFLGEKRLIVVQGLPQAPPARKTSAKKQDQHDELLKAFALQLEHLPESSVVVFVQPHPDKRKSFYKSLIKLAEVKTFEPLQGIALNQWLSIQIAERKLSMDFNVMQELIQLTGGDLWRLIQELNKLQYFQSGFRVTKAMLATLVTPVIEANIFHLTDALATRQSKKAIAHLHQLIAAGESLHGVMAMMLRQFRLLTQAKGFVQEHSSSDAKGFASAFGLHPFVARTVLGQQKAFDLATLKKAYEKFLSIDSDLKTGKIRLTVDHQEPLALALERFLLEMGS